MTKTKEKTTKILPWVEEIMKDYGTKKCDLLGFSVPKCVNITLPEYPDSKTHKYTVEIILKHPCEWEGQKNESGNFIAGTVKTVAWEERNSFHCLNKDVCLKDICALIRDRLVEITESDPSL